LRTGQHETKLGDLEAQQQETDRAVNSLAEEFRTFAGESIARRDEFVLKSELEAVKAEIVSLNTEGVRTGMEQSLANLRAEMTTTQSRHEGMVKACASKIKELRTEIEGQKAEIANAVQTVIAFQKQPKPGASNPVPCEGRIGALEGEIRDMEAHWRANLKDLFTRCEARTTELIGAFEKRTVLAEENVNNLKTALSGRDRPMQVDPQGFARIHEELGHMRTRVDQASTESGCVKADLLKEKQEMREIRTEVSRQKRALEVWNQFVGTLPKP
jgi:predicted  nucleic acid-binding Zn-ribbon protein